MNNNDNGLPEQPKSVEQAIDKFENSKIELEEHRCDRCGNDFLKGEFLMHLPFRNVYVKFCHICWMGLSYGVYKDVMRENIIKVEVKNNE